jgi:hypothetical protein
LLSPAQRANYIQLARHLIIASQAEGWDARLFDMSYIAHDLNAGEELLPDQVAQDEGLLLLGALGHAPRAGMAPLPEETWRAYQARTLGANIDNPLEDWLLSHAWLDIVEGRARPDYMTNGFLWDRAGLPPPESL